MKTKSWLCVAVVLAACGGGSSGGSTTESSATSESSSGSDTGSTTSAEVATGACYLASLGACQWFYDSTEEHSASGCGQLEGTFGSDCPTEGRLGDCLENGRRSSRFYAGGAMASDAAAAQSACERDGGTWAP